MSDDVDLELPLGDETVSALAAAARLHSRGQAWFEIDADRVIEILADEVLELRAELRQLRAGKGNDDDE